MESKGEVPTLRAYVLPFYAPGHLLPLVELAVLLSARGVDSTILLTPSNADIVRGTVERAASSGLPVRVLLYPFPSAAAGLPQGCESIATVPASEEPKVIQASSHAREAVEALLRSDRPDFVVSDPYFKWAPSAARDLGIPFLSFSPIGAFTVAVMVATMTQQGIRDSVEPIVVDGLPGPPIRLAKAELPPFIRTGDDSYREEFEAADVAYGLVINTFSALEQCYLDHSWRESIGKVWCVGPVGLFNEGGTTSDNRPPPSGSGSGRGGGEVESKCLEWLESRKPSSVVFVCFGSCCHFTTDQLHELALGLEESEHPFLWAVRDESQQPPWLPEGYEARVEGKGLIVRGWTPQVPILNHPSVGVFLTHCGWNSVLEAVSAGVPMLTWPLVFEQFITEKLVVDVLRIGSKVWNGFRSTVAEEKVLVPRQAIAEALKGFMGGDDRKETRRRAKEYSEMAKAAVEKGGSSANDLDRLIEDLRRQRQVED